MITNSTIMNSRLISAIARGTLRMGIYHTYPNDDILKDYSGPHARTQIYVGEEVNSYIDKYLPDKSVDNVLETDLVDYNPNRVDLYSQKEDHCEYIIKFDIHDGNYDIAEIILWPERINFEHTMFLRLKLVYPIAKYRTNIEFFEIGNIVSIPFILVNERE